ncbi:hypothetical protein L873DRAFT_95948 [Choiromyces venosus 120613-1]|uniref:Uncharacterized protein n=1 Tax=Choiromyces venosus 120613-1 TaxID=1336337 RepID=A0A3N4JZF0_9PEZI|nr:hypothetical protein L873DRAFT_95948 [Choiromyces venosus 120613-1]
MSIHKLQTYPNLSLSCQRQLRLFFSGDISNWQFQCIFINYFAVSKHFVKFCYPLSGLTTSVSFRELHVNPRYSTYSNSCLSGGGSKAPVGNLWAVAVLAYPKANTSRYRYDARGFCEYVEAPKVSRMYNIRAMVQVNILEFLKSPRSLKY